MAGFEVFQGLCAGALPNSWEMQIGFGRMRTVWSGLLIFVNWSAKFIRRDFFPNRATRQARRR